MIWPPDDTFAPQSNLVLLTALLTLTIAASVVAEKACIEPFGCFPNDPPFFDLKLRPIVVPPENRTMISVQFYLFSRANSATPQKLVTNDTALLSASSFDGRKKTKILVHGYFSNGLKSWMQKVRTELLKAEDTNVVQVDWSKGANGVYPQAVSNTRVVGAEIEHFIRFLERKSATHRQDFHILGHSLGSHIAGYTGHRLGGQLGRITGLDPAGPCFEKTNPIVRLDPSDAKFVDVIHTNGASILELGVGLMQPLGHVDFYPNGGQRQKDCSRNPLIQIIKNGLIQGGKLALACDHLRVNSLMAESIFPISACRFKAFPCDSYENFQAGKCLKCGNVGCARMGYWANIWRSKNPKTEVKMFLDTAGTENFCRYQYFVRVTTADKDFREERVRLFTTVTSSAVSSRKIALHNDAFMMRPRKSYSFFVTDKQLFGDLKQINFTWQHKWLLTLPGTMPLYRKPKVYLNSITFISGDTEKQYNFCFDGKSIRNDIGVTSFQQQTPCA